MKALLTHVARSAIDTILPPRCVVSGDEVDHQGMIAPRIWRDLSFVSDPKCESCGFPFEFDVMDGTLCASCLDYPPTFDSARSALLYDEQSRPLVLGFKHGDKTHAAKAFTPWLMMAGQGMLKDADLIVPVPLHRLRLMTRRYNQAAIMAHYLSKKSGIPVIVDALDRVRSTPPQGHLSAGERFKNVKKAFAVKLKRRSDMLGKKIVLIDDVYTTGATVNECTKALKKAGAAEVHVLTLARAARDGFG